MATAVERRVEQSETLTPEDQELRLMEHLRAKGIIARIPARHRQGYNPEDVPDQSPPIEVQGRPVSETLLEDRGPK